MQLWWKMDKRGFNHKDMDECLNDVFDPLDLQYITLSRWSKSQGMAVLKKSSILFDLDSVYADNELIDYSKGLTAEEKKNLCVKDKIKYGKIKAGDIAAKGNTS